MVLVKRLQILFILEIFSNCIYAQDISYERKQIVSFDPSNIYNGSFFHDGKNILRILREAAFNGELKIYDTNNKKLSKNRLLKNYKAEFLSHWILRPVKTNNLTANRIIEVFGEKNFDEATGIQIIDEVKFDNKGQKSIQKKWISIVSFPAFRYPFEYKIGANPYNPEELVRFSFEEVKKYISKDSSLIYQNGENQRHDCHFIEAFDSANYVADMIYLSKR